MPARLPSRVAKNHENHEPPFMDLLLPALCAAHTIGHPGSASAPGYPCLSTFKENLMTWEKPQAVDMRWGFEITMYIANR